MRSPAPPYLLAEPNSKLKTAALVLWNFAYLHGLNMDLCGRQCAKEALSQVEALYPQKTKSETKDDF